MSKNQSDVAKGSGKSDEASSSDGGAGAAKSPLSAAQEKALQHLSGGLSIREAAARAGVDRRSVHRWIKSDPHFGAAYNAWQQELIDSGRARVLAMSDAALNTVNAAIEKGNAYVALQLARATGVLTPARPGATDSEELQRRQRLRAGQRAKKLAAAEKQLNPDADKSRASFDEVDELEDNIDCFLMWRIKALAAETPEARERRIAKRNSQYTGHARTSRLLELVDAHGSGEFEALKWKEPFEPRPTPPLITPAPLGSVPSEGRSENRGEDAAAKPSPAPGPEASAHGGSGTAAHAAPGITKSVATRVQGSAARGRSGRRYDPDAELPTEGGPWQDL